MIKRRHFLLVGATSVALAFAAAPAAQAGIGCDGGIGAVRLACDPPASFQFPSDGGPQATPAPAATQQSSAPAPAAATVQQAAPRHLAKKASLRHRCGHGAKRCSRAAYA